MQQSNLEQANVEVGLGNFRPDRGAARLRDERQGDQRRRPDAAIHLRAVPLTGADDEHALSRSSQPPCSPLNATTALGAEPRRCDRRLPCFAPTSRVSGDVVRIGDVIDNAGTAAQIAIYRAPDLGTTGTLPTAQVLSSVARAPGDRRRYQGYHARFGDAAGAHARGQGHRAAGRPRAGTPQRARRRRQPQPDLRSRRAGSEARCLQHRRDAADIGALRSAQRPLRRHVRDRQRQRCRRRRGCASPAPPSRPSRPRCWRATSTATRC